MLAKGFKQLLDLDNRQDITITLKRFQLKPLLSAMYGYRQQLRKRLEYNPKDIIIRHTCTILVDVERKLNEAELFKL